MILHGDNMKIMPTLAAESFQTCVTSPPYWGLRDYGIAGTEWTETTYSPMPGLPPITVPAWTGCLGLEPTLEMFIAHIVLVFRQVWRLLKSDGTAWVNFGDSYINDPGNGRGGDGRAGLGNGGGTPHRSGTNKIGAAGLKRKDLAGIPWRVAFALQAEGWWLRSDIIWAKPNCMPESTPDRPTKAHEYVFLLAKSQRYYYDKEAIKEPGVQDEHANGFRGGAYTHEQTFDNQEGGKRKARGNFKVPTGRTKNSFAGTGKESPPPGQPPQKRADREPIEYSGMRNKRSVWTVATQGFAEAHFATFPEALIRPCILAGAPVGEAVLDPFGGSGTTLKVAHELGRECTIIEIGEQYVDIAQRRTAVIQPSLNL